MKKPTLMQGLLGVAVSLAVLYVTVYFGSKAWKKGQEK